MKIGLEKAGRANAESVLVQRQNKHMCGTDSKNHSRVDYALVRLPTKGN